MPQSPSSISSAVTILTQRRRKNEQGERLPLSCRPTDVDTALAIQSAVTEQLGATILGWKCGTPAADRVVLAPIYAGNTSSASPCPTLAPAGQVRVEPELAFVLAHDLPAREAPYTPDDVDHAIARTHLALELIGSRYANPAEASFVENLADGLLNQGLFLGPEVDGETARHATSFPICVTEKEGKELRLDGRHPNENPRAPLYWLAEFLRSRGQGLKAGQAVITGSYAGSFDVPADAELTFRFGALGQLKVRFVPR